MDAENLNEHKQEEPKDYDPPELPHKVVEQEGDEECIHRPHNEVRDSPGRVFNFSCILGQHIHYEAYIVLGEDIVTKMSNFLIEQSEDAIFHIYTVHPNIELKVELNKCLSEVDYSKDEREDDDCG